MKLQKVSTLYGRIRAIIESARSSAARSVNTAQVISNWLIGREIVEEEQKGKRRAGYGEGLMRALADRLHEEYGTGYGLVNLKLFKQFYLTYTSLAGPKKGYAASSLFQTEPQAGGLRKGYAPSSESWKPGMLHPNLSWTHYRTLLRVDKENVCAFYEIEAIMLSAV